jgi:hypothetical protein
MVAAAFRRGRIPAWGLLVGLVSCLGAAVLSALSLRDTGAPWLVAPVAAFAASGAVAAIVALSRLPGQRAPDG